MLSRSRSALCSVRTLVITSVLLEASSGVLLMISCSASDDPGGATLFAMTSQPIIKEGKKNTHHCAGYQPGESLHDDINDGVGVAYSLRRNKRRQIGHIARLRCRGIRSRRHAKGRGDWSVGKGAS